ncbi:MAG: ATP synthase subunit I [Deltaproteobacteria bacterium]|nr:ATP synthase subunit I [Deltaproteobacteria bacterium]
MEWEIFYEDLKKKYWIVFLLISSVSLFTLSPSHTLGVIAGSMVSMANFMFLQHAFKKVFGTDFKRKTRKISIFLYYYFRLSVLGVIIFILLKHKLVHPVGLIIGLSTVVISITVVGVIMAIKTGGQGA